MSDILISTIKEAILPELRQIVESTLNQKAQEELKEKFLSIDEARKMFTPQVSRTTIYNWMDADLIQSYQIGGKRYFRYSELLEAITKIKKYQR